MSLNTKSQSSSPKFSFHPFEIGFCGYSNSGKTTLISKLVKNLSKYKIGYVKHDAHQFEMDKPGKDTFVIKQSGADIVTINSKSQFALLGSGQQHAVDQSSALIHSDFVFVEGYKDFLTSKIVVIDNRQAIVKDVKEGRLKGVMAFVGESSHCADLPENIPYFQRDRIEQIQEFIMNYIFDQTQAVPLYGLVLAGGRSTRMGEDKSKLSYYGKPQVEHCTELLSSCMQKVYVSSRENQLACGDFKQIYDTFIDQGPMGGILSAMTLHPKAAWLVLACDLPFVNDACLQELIVKRNSLKFATAYLSTNDNLPEPLCAIYEPKCRMRMMQFLSYGMRCPRKVLMNSEVEFLSLTNTKALNNINHFHEYQEVFKEIQNKKVVV